MVKSCWPEPYEFSLFDNPALLSDMTEHQINTVSNRRQHELMHTGERSFTYRNVDGGFAQARNVRVRKRLHTDKRSYICQWCDKRFNWASNLRAHELLHTGRRPFICQAWQIKMKLNLG